MDKERIDLLLVELGLAERRKAIMAGEVLADDQRCTNHQIFKRNQYR